MILLNYKDKRPIYEQIVENFQQMILCGALAPDSPMPSVRSLAMELSLNPNTIQRAYQDLERQGYIYTVKGKGSFVSDSNDNASSKRLEILSEMTQVSKKAISIGASKKEIEDLWKEAVKKAFEE